MRKVALYGTLTVTLATLVHVLHGVSHTEHRVSLATWQWAYVMVAIFLAPVVAAVLLWTRLRVAGAWLLLASMAAALIFGLAFHFLLAGPDNVFTSHAGTWRAPFVVTAALVALFEAFGVGVGVWAVARLSRAPAGGKRVTAGLGEPR